MPHLLKQHRKKLFLLLFLIVVVSGWIYWNRPKKDDMATYVPADALAFIEANDLDAIAGGIQETGAWRVLAGPLGAPATLLPHRRLIQLARWTGIGSAEAVLAARSQVAFIVRQPQATESEGTLTIKPLVAMVIETHTAQRRMKPVLEKQVERFAQRFYGQPTLSRKQFAGVDIATWSSADNTRHLVLAFIETVAIVGNDEALVMNCVEVRRGLRPSLANNIQLAQARGLMTTTNSQVFGFIPKAGVKPAVQAWALNRAGGSPNAGIVVQLISSTFGNMIDAFAWTSKFENGNAEDRCYVALAEGVAEKIRPSISPQSGALDTAFQFVPAESVSVTSYQFHNADSFWRDLNTVMSSHSDVLGAITSRPLLRTLLEPYGILDADGFFSAAGPRLQIIRVAENSPAVLVAEAFDRATLRKLAQQRLGAKSRTEMVGDAELLTSATDNWSAALVGNYFLSGPADSVRRCLAAKAQSQSITGVETFRRSQAAVDATLPIIALSYSKDRQAAISFVELFSRQERSTFSANADEIQRASQTLPYAVTATLMQGNGLEWSSRSSFGLLGSFFTTFRPERSP
ncbi:MAG TPA: hypothetical protein VJT50_07200 [Pyrinomonadaceae bacterium]|nr:hypothetical protein [Pyrinomonadaceae bacterium]